MQGPRTGGASTAEQAPAAPAVPPAGGTAGAAARRAAARRRLGAWALAGALVGAVQFAVVHHSLVDDAYITLTYARNVALHGTWGLLSDVTSNTATSPLFVLVLAAVTLVVRSGVAALGVVTVGCWALLAAAVAGTARATGASRATAPLAVGLVLVDPLLLSSAGLETLLYLSLLAALAWAAATGRAALLGVVGGLLVLTRVDAGLFVAVAALGTPRVLRRLPVAVGAALVVAVPWFAFSWYALGSAIPDTLLLKQDETWEGWTFSNGLQLYSEHYPVATLLSLLAPLAGLVLAAAAAVATAARGARWHVPWRASGPWVLLAAGGLGVYLAYGQLVVPPYHWYYGSAVGSLCLAAAGLVGVLLGRRAAGAEPRAPRSAGLVAAGALGMLVVVPAGFDASRGPLWSRAVINSNWAAPAQYLAMGADLRREVPGGQRALSPGEIGTLQYQCDCLVDRFSDPALLEPVIRARLATATGLGGALLRLDYRHHRAGTPVPTPLQVVRARGSAPPPGTPPGAPTWHGGSPWAGPSTFALEPVPR